jgi:hypothetical protein
VAAGSQKAGHFLRKIWGKGGLNSFATEKGGRMVAKKGHRWLLDRLIPQEGCHGALRADVRQFGFFFDWLSPKLKVK